MWGIGQEERYCYTQVSGHVVELRYAKSTIYFQLLQQKAPFIKRGFLKPAKTLYSIGL